MKKIEELLTNNREWAADVKQQDPEFFAKLSKQQTPKYLWIGCSDSRVPANQIVDLMPGEIFVHRNIANQVIHTDLNCRSVMQYAIEVLQVEHVIVCGHYGCGGVKAAMGEDDFGLIDNWLLHIKDVYHDNKDTLADMQEEQAFNFMCERNVEAQVANVCRSNIVQQTWKAGRKLTVHGWIYGLEDGLIKDLEVSASSQEQIPSSFRIR